MRKLITTLLMSTLMMLIPMSLIASQPNLELNPPTTNVDLDLDLTLPLEVKHTIDGQLFYSYTPDNFRLSLKIYKTYTFLAEAHVLLLKDIKTLEVDVNYLINAVDSCLVTLEDVNKDRNFIYKLRESDISRMKRNEKKQILKTVLFTGGGIAVGLGIGILIGIFAI